MINFKDQYIEISEKYVLIYNGYCHYSSKFKHNISLRVSKDMKGLVCYFDNQLIKSPRNTLFNNINNNETKELLESILNV